MLQQTDEKTLKLIDEVRRQEAEIAKLDHPVWKTNCSFSYTEGRADSVCNLHVESNVEILIKIAAFLTSREAAYNEVIKTLDLGADMPPFKWNGFHVPDWLDDLKTRIGKIQISSKRKKLETLKTRLEGIVSPELRAQLELEAIEKELSSK